MISIIKLWFKFRIKVSSNVLAQAPCQDVSSWVLISEKESNDCQGNWYERFFYSRKTKQLFYGLSDRYIFLTNKQGKKLPIIEFVEMNQEYISKMPIEEMQKIADKIKDRSKE